MNIQEQIKQLEAEIAKISEPLLASQRAVESFAKYKANLEAELAELKSKEPELRTPDGIEFVCSMKGNGILFNHCQLLTQHDGYYAVSIMPGSFTSRLHLPLIKVNREDLKPGDIALATDGHCLVEEARHNCSYNLILSENKEMYIYNETEIRQSENYKHYYKVQFEGEE